MAKKNKPIRVKLIANPGAGNVLESAARVEQVTQYLLEYGLKVDIALAHPKREAIPIARKAAKDGYDIVVAMGGDGTLGTVIRGIAGSKVKLGIIAAGTENDIAGSLGIPDDLKEACALIASGHPQNLDVQPAIVAFADDATHDGLIRGTQGKAQQLVTSLTGVSQIVFVQASADL